MPPLPLYNYWMLVVGLLTLLFSSVTPSAAQYSPHSSYAVISTKLGQVRGQVVHVASGVTSQAEEDLRAITQFLGVPYALPPIGQLRFQEPQQTNGWMLQGILNTTVPRQHCPVEVTKHHQPTESYDEKQAEEDREDCLYMNIYVPGNLSSNEYIDTMELPVLVIFSEEEQDLKDAFSYFAYYGHIIIIDLSYRSGVLSYLRISGDKVTSGNIGFQDQRLALLWIWDNVREFGGNPEEITVFAEYRASISLGYQVLQPNSRSLFARAVMHSGTPLSQWYLQHDHSAMTLAVSNALGCSNSTSAAVTECIRSIALHKLLKAAEVVELNYTLWRRHMADPKPVPSLESFADGQFNQVDLLIGSSEHDGLCLMQETSEPEILNKILKVSIETLIRNTMKDHYRNVNKSEQSLQTVVDAVLFEYSSCNIKKNKTKTVADFLTDMMYRAPAEWTARLTSQHDSSVYLYLVSSKNYSCSSLKSLIKLTENVQKPVSLAKNFIDVLVNFVRKGNPNPLNELDSWKPFTERERYFLQFTDEETHLKQSIRHRKMAFWNDYFPYLLDLDLDSCQTEDGVLTNSFTDDEVDDEDVLKIALVVCFLVAVGVALSLLLFLLIRWHHSHRLSGRHRSCIRCCKTGQQPNCHDLITSATIHESEDCKLHPLPYSEESAWN